MSEKNQFSKYAKEYKSHNIIQQICAKSLVRELKELLSIESIQLQPKSNVFNELSPFNMSLSIFLKQFLVKSSRFKLVSVLNAFSIICLIKLFDSDSSFNWLVF